MSGASNLFSFLAFVWPGGTEWIILLVLGLLIFGRRLPEVGRSLGRSIVEFKRGIKGIEDEVETESSKPKEFAGVPESPSLEPPEGARVSRESPQPVSEPASTPAAAPAEPSGETIEQPDTAPAGSDPDRPA